MAAYPSPRQLALSLPLLMACAGLVCRLWFFTDWTMVAQRERELMRSEFRIEEAKKLARRQPQMEVQHRALLDAVREDNESNIAPAGETFPWASHFITIQAGRLGLDIRVLTPLSNCVAPWEAMTADYRQLKLFAVRLDVLATYAQTMKLVGCMEASNPLLTLTTLSSVNTGRDGGRSRVTMVWEWPLWKDTPAAARLHGLIGGGAHAM